MKNREIAIALHQLPGVGNVTLSMIDRLVEGDWMRLVEEDMLLRALQLSDDLIELILQHLNMANVEEISSKLHDYGIKVVLLGEEDYPDMLTEISNPPFILYGIGDMSLLNHSNCIGIVGTRTPSSYGQMVAHRLAGDLSESGWIIVSGMASGIDTYAHRGTLAVKGKTIAVLGCGIDIIYPTQNKKLYEEISETGLILSEYAPQTSPTKGTFPQRNRIISGLSRGIVVVESHNRSGSLITASWALEQGKEVFAVPGSILSAKSAGPHKLIKEGAKLITSAKDIIEELAYPIQSQQYIEAKGEIAVTIALEEELLLDLISYHQIHIDEIFKAATLSRGEIHQYLLSLEMKKMIKKLPGYFYVKIKG